MDSTSTYLVFVVLGVGLVIIVGQILSRAGQAYLAEVFPEPKVSSSVSRLLAVMFYLFALGVLGVISTMDVPVEGAAQIVVTKLGVVMLVLGIVYALTMVVLSKIRAGRREEEEEEAYLAANLEQANEDTVVEDTSPTSSPGREDDTGHTEGRPTDARLV